MTIDLPACVLVWVAYTAATLSPGPASLAIAGLAASEGRARAVPFALGVVAGSMAWGVVAALGIVAVVTAIGWAFLALKIAGSLYLGWMAWRDLRAALAPPAPLGTGAMPQKRSRLVAWGVLFHLTNPKAAFAWAALVSIGLTPDASGATVAVMIAGCGAIGVLTFGGLAVLFSLPGVVVLYGRARRLIQLASAAVFGLFAVRLATLKAV